MPARADMVSDTSGKFPPNGSVYHTLTAAEIAQDKAIHALDVKAMNALNAQQYTLAEADARKAQATGEDPGFAQEVIAACFHAEGKTQEALQEYQKMEHGGISNAADALGYCQLLLQTGQWAKAVSIYNLALTLGGQINLLRANTSFSPDDPQPTALEAALDIAISTDNGYWLYHGNYQQCLQERVAEAQKALALEPDSALAHFYCGLAWAQSNLRSNRKQARLEYQKAIDTGTGQVKAEAQEGLKDVP